MLTLLSPAKTYRPAPPPPPPGTPPSTLPLLLGETATLVALVQALSRAEIAALMKISPPLAQRTFDEFASFSLPFTEENSLPSALLAFGGEVYRGLDAPSLSAAELAFAQEHLLILSGLYGALRPLDRLRPYRLELGTGLPTPRGRGLYRFWGAQITAAVAQHVAGHPDRTVLNLASEEYASAVAAADLPGPMVTPVFQEAGGRVVAVHAKRARGQMARFVVQHRLDEPSALRDYDREGYRLRPERSTAQVWVFARG